ncbi:elongation factor G [Candidatus Margulisiibacteriota bacterium]
MKEYKSEEIRNIAIIGSSNIGKTCLGEAILYDCKATTRIGSTDDGSSVLDTETDEISRHFSISSHIYSVEHNKNKLNFIDTPGYPAFVSQVITAASVCETALVVLGAVTGVEVLTKKIWSICKKEKMSKFIFVNRMDRASVDFEQDLERARAVLSKKIFPIIYPIGSGEKFQGIIDIIKNKAYLFNNGDEKEAEIPAALKPRIEELRSELMEAAAENNEEILEKYLDKGDLSEEDLIKGIKIGVRTNDIIPLLDGSSHKNIGIKRLLDYLSILAPNPIEKEKIIECVTKDGQQELKKINKDGTSLVQVFKIKDEPKIGESFYFKVFQGSLKSSQELVDHTTKQKERFGHLFIYSGKNKSEVSVLNAGDLGATAKLKSVQIGNTLNSAKENLKIKPFDFPTPVISQAVVTSSQKERDKLASGLQMVKKIDPCFKVEHVREFNELVVSGMSKLHIEVMMDRIKDRYSLNYDLEKPHVPYRETLLGTASGQGKYKKQTGGHGQYGDCWLEIMSKPVGSGYNFVNKISGGVIPSKYIPAVEKGVVDAMTKGILAGYPVVDVQVKLFDGSHHAVDSSDLAFQMAGVMAFKNVAPKAQPKILEPIMSIKVIVPENFVGDISADFNQRRGKIVSMDTVEDGYKMIRAFVPMAELYGYSIDLKSMTKGEGIYTKYFEKYELVPANIEQKIVQEAKA